MRQRYFCGGIKSGLAIAIGSLLPVSPLTAAPIVKVSVAYYDTEHTSPSTPNPWLGSPDTTFFGTPDGNGIFDTGAILLTNTGTADSTISPGLQVGGFANGATFQLWNQNITPNGLVLHPGKSVIFAQPGSGLFDTSDQPIISDPNLRTNDQPHVYVTIDGRLYNFTDLTQVLNTGGFDPGEAYHVSESRPWTEVGTTPEPSGGLLVGLVVAGLASRFRHKRL